MEENRASKFGVINKGTVVEQIITSITEAIISGRFKSGMKLPNEYELIEEFKVSRNSLREAIKILSAMGIVEIRRGDGTYICEQVNPSIFDTIVYSLICDLSTDYELLELRQILDEMTIRLAIDKITSSELQALSENIKQMSKAYDARDTKLARKLDFEFHMMIIEACKNILFVRILKGVYTIFESSIANSVERKREDSKGVHYHTQILKCIQNKEYGKVREVVSESLMVWYEIVREK